MSALKRWRVLAVVITASLAGSVASASDATKHAIRFGPNYLIPGSQKTLTAIIDFRYPVTVSNENALGAYLEYEFRGIPLLGLEFTAAYANPKYSLTDTQSLRKTSGREQFVTGLVGLNFHVLKRSRADLYLGLDAGWVFFQKYKEAFSYGAKIGLDVGLTKRLLALALAVRYNKVRSSAEDLYDQYLERGSVDFDPLGAQVGLSFRF